MRAVLLLLLFLLSACSNQAVDKLSKTDGDYMTALKLTSPAFADNGKIPVRYTCDGDNVNPQLKIEGVPSNAKSLVLSKTTHHMSEMQHISEHTRKSTISDGWVACF